MASTDEQKTTRYCVVDIETTGRKPVDTKIIEIAAYIVESGEIKDSFETLINPDEAIDFFITKLTGINDKMVRQAPRFKDIAAKFSKKTENCVFVAHNVSFDYSIIRREFRRLGMDYRRDHLCTIETSRKVIKDVSSYNLGNLAKLLGISIPNRHRASDDALATVELLNYLDKETEIEAYIRHEIKPELLHPKLNLKSVDNIPDKPGLLTYYDENNEVIYIEGTRWAHQAVYQKIRPSKKKQKPSQELIAKINYVPTGSELLAAILAREKVMLQEHTLSLIEKDMSFLYCITVQEMRNGKLQLVAEKNHSGDAVLKAKSKAELKKMLDDDSKHYKIYFPFCDTDNSQNFETDTENNNKEVLRWVEERSLPKGNYLIIDKGTKNNEHSAVLIENSTITFAGLLPRYLLKSRDSEAIKKELKTFSGGTGSEELVRRHLIRKNYKGMVPL